MNKNILKSVFTALVVLLSTELYAVDLPWNHGKLKVSDNNLYIQHEDGTPFFWLGDTGWLLPQRTTKDQAAHYLEQIRLRGFNVVQVQTMNDVPSENEFGDKSVPADFNFDKMVKENRDGYWDYMDYVIRTAAKNGIYVGMTCIWGGPVNAGQMNVEQAKKYGKFLAERYKNEPNILWFIGGDIRGDVKTEVWLALAETIRAIDTNHLMTFHPRGRTTSAAWFNDASWLDFNMFQSGHRRYGQRKGDGDYPIEENTEEDNWRFVERSLIKSNLKPVLDGEPIYEDIPHGLHEENEARWNAADVRRYAYWSVFAGSFGHTYGHNSIMQFYKPGIKGSFFPHKYWYECFDEPGYNQMKYLKELMLKFPYFERITDQSVIVGDAGFRYDRLIATRANDYLMVYNYTGRPMVLDLTKISGDEKSVWWMNPSTGEFSFIEKVKTQSAYKIQPDVPYSAGNDRVLIAFDASKTFLK